MLRPAIMLTLATIALPSAARGAEPANEVDLAAALREAQHEYKPILVYVYDSI